MKKVVRELLQKIVEMKTQEDVDAICCGIDMAYQNEKITAADNELLYDLIRRYSKLI